MYVEYLAGMELDFEVLDSGTSGQTAYNFTAAGAAYGTAKSGIGIAGVGTFRSDLIMKVRNLLRPISMYTPAAN